MTPAKRYIADPDCPHCGGTGIDLNSPPDYYDGVANPASFEPCECVFGGSHPPAEREHLIAAMADAILTVTYPPAEWPEGPPGEGEADTAREQAAAALDAVLPKVETWRLAAGAEANRADGYRAALDTARAERDAALAERDTQRSRVEVAEVMLAGAEADLAAEYRAVLATERDEALFQRKRAAHWRKRAERYRDERDQARAQVEQVRLLHTISDLGECVDCRASWPCPTITALDFPASAPESPADAEETTDE